MPKYAKVGKSALFTVLLASAWVTAGGVKPTQEFWDYMMEYSDEQGEILDPLEYDQIYSLKEEKDATQTDDSQSPPLNGQHPAQTNATSMTKTTSLKDTSSSSRSSSVSAKGAPL